MPRPSGFDGWEAHVLDKDGCPLHYWTGGNPAGTALVMLHGAGADHRTFAPQLRVLEPQYRLLAWDARGHGRSRPMGKGFSFSLLMDDLLAILDREAVPHAILMGHSMGGNLAQEVARRAPERVDALIAIDCTRNTGTLTWSEGMAMRLAPRILSWYPWGPLVSEASHASSVKDDVRRYMAECFRVLGHRDFTRIFLETARAVQPEPSYCFGKPLLILAGDQDPTGNVKKVAERWAEAEPRATYVLVPNAGHAAHQDNPRAVNEALSDFLGSLSHADEH